MTLELAKMWPPPFLNVAFVASILFLVACVAVTLWYGQRRPLGTPVTWGEAMAAGVFLFAVMFVAYGIMPHQWLTFADNQLRWRSDKIVMGPGNIIDKGLPFTVSYQAVRDLVAGGLYVIVLMAQGFLWTYWQRRGRTQPKALPTSAFGRPLLRPAKTEGA
jgi:hypothetical protein